MHGAARLTLRGVVPLLALLCLGVACGGPPMVPPEGPGAVPVPPPPRRGEGQVRVVTFNAWALPLVSRDLVERTRRLGPALAALEPDVICLQEMYSAGARSRVVGALDPAWRPAAPAQGGLLVLTRLPVQEARYVAYPDFPGLSLSERIAAKGILDVVLETPAGPLRVVTTHLALAFGEGNPRSRQLDFLLDHLERRRDLPLVVAADLNTPPVTEGRRTDDFLSIEARGLRSADPPRRIGDRWVPGTPTRVTWPRPEVARRVFYPDHVLVRDGAEGRVEVVAFGVTWTTPATALSDHNLLVADLRLGAP